MQHPVEQDGAADGLTERLTPGGGQCEDGAEREHVAGGPGRPALSLLGGHVAGRADHVAGLGEAGGGVQGAGDAEVDQPGAVEGEQHVRRFDVAVDQAQSVDVGERFGEADAEQADGGFGERAVFVDGGREGGAGHVAGGDPGLGALGVGVQDRRGPCAADSPGGGDLLAEPGPELLVPGQLGADGLHGHGPPAGGPAQVDLPHSARPELPQQPVRTQVCRVVRTQWLHGRTPSGIGRSEQTLPARGVRWGP